MPGTRPTIQQVAALPYRLLDGEEPSATWILLVTSRQTGRWVVPKGNLMVGKAPHEAAEIEALEEAGVRGMISPLPIGAFRYRKMLTGGAFLLTEVDLFPMHVAREMPSWPEMHQRERRWFTAAEAAIVVDEVDLGELIHRFGEGEGPRPGN